MRLRFTKSYKPKVDLNDKQAVADEAIEYFSGEYRLSNLKIIKVEPSQKQGELNFTVEGMSTDRDLCWNLFCISDQQIEYFEIGDINALLSAAEAVGQEYDKNAMAEALNEEIGLSQYNIELLGF